MSNPPALPQFHGRLAIQQRVLPAYRVAFLDLLATHCSGGVDVFAGLPLPEEQIPVAKGLDAARWTRAQNRNFLSVRSPFYRCYQPGLVEWLESVQPDTLIVEANPRYSSTPAAIQWMHARGRPVLGWGLGSPHLKGVLSGWRLNRRKKFLMLLDGIIAYSLGGAAEYLQLGFMPHQVFTAPNAAAPRPNTLPPQRPLTWSEPPTVLFVGRLQARKRVDLLLQACATLPEILRPKLLIVGDGPERAALEVLADQIYPAAKFLGAVYGSDLADYFKRADLFVLPGTGGLAVQQAMSWGLPVIVAEGDGTQGDLVRPENGVLIHPNDLTALATALQSALSDLPKLRRMGEASYRIVREEINLEMMVDRFLAAVIATYTRLNAPEHAGVMTKDQR